MKALTKSEFERLKPYEDHFRRAVVGGYLRNPGREGTQAMDAVLRRIDPTSRPTDVSCSHCLYATVGRVGALYFAYKSSHETGRQG